MGASSLWDQVGLPLFIGLAIEIVVTALCFLSVRLWNCLMKQMKTQTAVEESTHGQSLPESDAAAHANDVPDLEMGNGYGPAQGEESVTEPEIELGIGNSGEGGESMPEPELELGIVNGGEGNEHFSDQEAHTPVIESPVTTPKAQVTGDATRRALVSVEMDVPRSQHEEVDGLAGMSAAAAE